MKKFLGQYPSLFLVDGDFVHINSFQHADKEDSTGQYGGRRDYIKEAKEYFKHKMLQYGVGTEVPIKSLLGHRSQAAPQVRHISGESFVFIVGMFDSISTNAVFYLITGLEQFVVI